MKHTCPVCGFGMDDPAEDYNICPCCHTEFEVDDVLDTVETLRRRWIGKGMPWVSRYTEVPEGWNPEEQLKAVENE